MADKYTYQVTRTQVVTVSADSPEAAQAFGNLVLDEAGWRAFERDGSERNEAVRGHASAAGKALTARVVVEVVP